MQSVRTFMAGLVDYAGLFPPAGLEMAAAVRSYAKYLAGPNAEMLGRFIVSAPRLAEFSAATARQLPRGESSTPWKISLLLTESFESEIKAALKFNCEHWGDSAVGHAVIDSVEIKAADAESVAALKSILPDFYRAFAEVSVTSPNEAILDAVQAAGYLAKIRTGGTDAGAFPSAVQVLAFLRACNDRGLSFKATAGLHHIVCASHALTYEPKSAKAEMFGFLNVFAAAAFLYSGTDDVTGILSERNARAFVFENESLGWQGQKISLAQIRKARAEFALSFGSCSFTEPVEELEKVVGQRALRVNVIS